MILKAVVRELLSKRHILLNEGNVNYIDNSGIVQLVSAFTTVRNQNRTKRTNDLVQITKLYTVFDVKDDEAGAIKSFNADTGGSILSIIINCDSVADDLSIPEAENFESGHRTGPFACQG